LSGYYGGQALLVKQLDRIRRVLVSPDRQRIGPERYLADKNREMSRGL
jgi:hypothetical protein